MANNDNVNFDELLQSLNKAIEDNDTKGYRQKISDTYDKLKNGDMYGDGSTGDIFVDKLESLAKQFRDPEDGTPTASEDALAQATAEFTVDESHLQKAQTLENTFSTLGTTEFGAISEEKEKERIKTGEKLKSIFNDAKSKVKKKAEKAKVIPNVEEYTSAEQNKKFLSGFRKEHNSILLRTALTGLFAFLLFYVDLIPITRLKLLPSVLMPPEYNVAYLLVQLQLLFFIILINYKSLTDGFLSLVSGEPNPNSVVLIITFAVIIHDIITVLTCTKETSVCLYNSVCAVSFLTAIAYEKMCFKTRLSAFRVASGKNSKYIISQISSESSENAVFSDYSDDVHKEMYSVTKTKFTENVMKKLYTKSRIEKYIKPLMLASLAASAVFFIISLRFGGEKAFQIFTLCLMMTMPVSLFVSASYPSARAQAISEQNGTAILGPESAEKLADAGVMSFNDSDVFPSTGIKVNNIYIYGNNRIDLVIYYAAGAFAKLGGPLKDVFASADEEGAGACENINMLSVGKNGFTMMADGKTVTVGKATYLREKGYLTKTSEEDAAYESKCGRIMYMAFDNNIAAKFYIKYTMDPEFDVLLKKADDMGLYVGVRTFDPNIDDSLLAQTLNLKKYPVKVVKLKLGEALVTETEKEDCPAVSRGAKGGSKALLAAMLLGSKMKNLKKIHLIFSAVAVVIAVIITAFLLVAGTYTSAYGIYPILFQLLWIVISSSMTNISLQ